MCNSLFVFKWTENTTVLHSDFSLSDCHRSLIFCHFSLQSVLSLNPARGLKFHIYEIEGMYYLCNKNKGADLLQASAPLFFACAKSRFSHGTA